MAGQALYYFAPSYRDAALHNISHLLGKPRSHPSVVRAARGTCVCLVHNYDEMLRISSSVSTDYEGWVEILGHHRLKHALDAGKGAVIATAHLGNVDLAGNSLLVSGLSCAVLTERIEPDWFFEFYVKERTRFNAVVIPYHPGVMPQLLRTVGEGRALGIATDWDMQGNGIPVQVSADPPLWLRIPVGTSLLALRARAPLIPVFSHRLPNGKLRVVIEQPIPLEPTRDLRADSKRVSEAVAARLLARLRAHPDQWVLFHKVWDTTYPGK